MAAAVNRRRGRSGGRVAAAFAALVAIMPWTLNSPAGQLASSPDGAIPATSTGADAMDPLPDRDLGPTDPAEMIEFSVVLRPPRPERLRAFLVAVNDPSSPEFRRFLTAEEYGRRFGPSDAAIGRVVAWLEARGFSVEAPPAQRTSLAVRGRVDHVNAAFDISMRDHLDDLGRRYHAPDREAQVPARIGRHVQAVAALNSHGPDPALSPVLAAIPGGTLRPADVARAYEIEELHADGLHGEGQAIGIVSFDTFLDSDVEAFDEEAGVEAIGGGSPPPVRRVRLPGAATEPGENTTEVNLDIDVVRAIAPQAQIINYESPNAAFGPVIREIVDRQEVDIVSISWGLCERKLSPGERIADDAEFDAAAATGISVFVASGDHGAHDCRFWPLPRNNSRYRDLGLSVTSPGSPSVILVGGTYLSVNTDGSYLEEAGWEDALTGWASGGGLSEVYDRPSWQLGAGVENAHSTGMRQGPDVAGPADGDSGFLVVYTPPGGTSPVVSTFGGTSASAPFWAASMVLARQLAEREGVSAGGFGRLGALGPELYRLSASTAPGALFHDVVKGGNLYHNAGVGWDYATGLGSPRVGPLARAIVDALR